MLKGHAINHRLEKIEGDVWHLKNKVDEIDFQIKTNLPPNEGIFYDGQIFDDYKKQFTKAHDRFLIIDNETVYHIGASLKDLGKKPVVSEVESMVCILKNQPRCE